MPRWNNIPPESRRIVRERAGGRCERCGTPTASGQWHHRRRRAVIDEHTHTPSNGIWLCPTCHGQVHSDVKGSVLNGWIVSIWADDPATVPVLTPWGPRRLYSDGTYRDVEESEWTWWISRPLND